MSKIKNNKQTGMTLIEIVIVISVLSIFGGIASVKLKDTMSFSSGIQATKFSQNIRHAQSLAINWGCELDFTTTAIDYSVTNRTAMTGKICDIAAAAITDPATGNNFSILLEDGVTFTAGTGTFFFDSLGRPNNGGGILSTNTSFTLSGNNANWQIIIAPITGFVSTNKI